MHRHISGSSMNMDETRSKIDWFDEWGLVWNISERGPQGPKGWGI